MSGNPKYKFRNIFNLVVARYHAEIENQWPSVEKRYKKLAEDHSYDSYNPRVLLVNGSDFIADVELSAKEVLSPYQYNYFKGWYLEQNQEIMRLYFSRFNKSDYLDFNLTMQEVVGAKFKQDKIHPIDEYFAPKSL